jgi:hypothetical protein
VPDSYPQVEIDPCPCERRLPRVDAVTRSGTDVLAPLVIDATAVAHAAGQTLDAAAQLVSAASALLPALNLSASAFGDGAGAAALARAHRDGADDLALALDGLRQVLEGDADRLYRVAFSVRATDEAAHGRLVGVSGPQLRARGPFVSSAR